MTDTVTDGAGLDLDLEPELIHAAPPPDDDGDGEQSGQSGQAGDGHAGPALLDDGQLDGLALELAFVLGRLRLPLAGLRQLRTGAVLALDDGSPAAVRIECGGRRLGSAEIVNVGGRLGLRVLEWDGVA